MFRCHVVLQLLQAVVVVASWCASSSNITLDINWAQLGLDATKVHITQPAVKEVQMALDHGPHVPTLTISGAVNGGTMLVIKPS